MMFRERKYSDYYKQLELDAKKQYNGGIGRQVDDPYTFNFRPGMNAAIPDIKYPDIYKYLINTPSPYTKEELKAVWRAISICWQAG